MVWRSSACCSVSSRAVWKLVALAARGVHSRYTPRTRAAAATMPPAVNAALANVALAESLVGFSTFPDQVFRRCVKDGFEFTLMVVGESGLGKSTFINSLFLAEIYDPRQRAPPAATAKTTGISMRTMCLEEEGVRLNMTFVDTPGFGDHVDNTNCWKPIVKFIDERFADYLNEETRIERAARIEDKRVHLLLYFVAPRHGLSELDVLAMKALQDRVNIVPVIAKADTLMPDELMALKQKLQADFSEHAIKLYEFPEPDESTKRPTPDYRKRIPFAVVGSNELRDNGRTKSRVRKYLWGTVEVDNLDHNDFIALRDMLINQNMMELIDVTRELHYEHFRARQMQRSSVHLKEDPFTCLEREHRDLVQDMQKQHNMKEDIFKTKVAEHVKRLDDEEKKLTAQELEYKTLTAEKQAQLNTFVAEISATRQSRTSTASLSGASESDGLKKKKSSTLSLFRRDHL